MRQGMKTVRETLFVIGATVAVQLLFVLIGAVFVFKTEQAPPIGRFSLHTLVFVSLGALAFMLRRRHHDGVAIAVGEALGSLLVTLGMFLTSSHHDVFAQWPAYLWSAAIGGAAGIVGTFAAVRLQARQSPGPG